MAARLPTRIRCEGRFERELRTEGYRYVAGLDEAGRGALFGPVFAAAVILDENRPIRGLNDSKQIEPERREVLAERIRERAVAWAVGMADAFEIDRINIYQASRLAMSRAVLQLAVKPDFLLLDAMRLELPQPQLSLIKGDARSRCIAAASILAKTHRDHCMRAWDQVFPVYCLSANKGYSTPDHLRALESAGPTELHRYTFEPVRRYSRARWELPTEPQLELFPEILQCQET